MEKLIEKNYFLHLSAKEAYKAYVRAYASHSMKNVYDVEKLDLVKVAYSFGFHVAPVVDIGKIIINFFLLFLKELFDIFVFFFVQEFIKVKKHRNRKMVLCDENKKKK